MAILPDAGVTAAREARDPYAEAGVDTRAGDRAVELMKRSVAATHGPSVLGGVGGFAGLWDASALVAYRRPVLATSTDGVGTKLAIARAMDRHDTIGQDLVGMVVDDVVVVGATPLFMTDYIACGRVVPERIAQIVAGIAAACADTGTALLGGETAEHPDLMPPDEYDLAGAAVGVVEADRLLGPDRVRVGDAVLAMASSGLHSNGFSLVRRIVRDRGAALGDAVPELRRALGEELLEPTRLYAAPLLEVLGDDVGAGVHALAHVTGGGIAANLVRVLPAGLVAELDRSTWGPQAVFSVLADWGGFPLEQAEGTWNLGVGMLAVADPVDADSIRNRLSWAGVATWQVGTVTSGPPAGPDWVRGAKGADGGAVRLVGTYRS